MFTGIVEELGTIKNVQKSASSMQLIIQAKRILEDIKLGDSIAVNGVCLTVIAFSNSSLRWTLCQRRLMQLQQNY